jgi:hypothetical protein
MCAINSGVHKRFGCGVYEWGNYTRKTFSVKCLKFSRHVAASYLFTVYLLRIYLHTVYLTTLLVDHMMVTNIQNKRSKNDV